ncbi:tyrosine-protein phosphatase [Peribacillus sp. B-H-3]|uniref:tyrosine-protein phosphatase n=1 Tax=Peribacillus sp. B-H-3 TaxID=3400420 RepID=UPI003B02037D
MIDISTHILPGCGDGPESMSPSVEMARKFSAAGISAVFATPHHKNGKYDNFKQDILLNTERLNAELQQEDIPLTVYPGQKTKIYGDLIADIDNGEILPLNDGKYLLLELPYDHVPKYTEQLLYDLQIKGLIPILAGLEHNPQIMEQPDLLYELVRRGALTMIGTSSIMGDHKRNIQRFSLQMIDSNLAHFISTNHNGSREALQLSKAYDIIEKKLGKDTEFLFRENPQYVIEGTSILKDAPQRIKKKKSLGIF